MPDNPDSTSVAYRFELPDGTSYSFTVSVGARPLERTVSDPPEWAKLDVHKCPHCPLDATESPWCPAALSISDAVKTLGDLWSHQRVALTVTTPERSFVFDDVQLQDALRSLMGLVLATSGCPHTAFFRPMARFHTPMSSVEETVYRATSMYLLGQWVRRSEGGDTDFSQLLPMAVEESLAPLRPMFEAYVRPPGSPGAG